jgi:hypothetical protein
MKINELNYRLSSIFSDRIELFELVNQDAKKWYERSYKHYPENEFKENFIYGVKIDGIIQFTFAVKNFDNLMKSFYTNFINKYLAIQSIFVDGKIEKRGVQRSKELFQSNMMTERLEKFLTYSTNYGIGVWIFFILKTDFAKIKQRVEKVLEKNAISFTNEYSDAGWVYRYKFSGNYLDHNLIIEQL